MNPRGTPSNLKPFPPGTSGNPAGRPRTRPITDRLREKLDDPAVVDGLVEAWLLMARTGDSAALRELLNRTEGKVADHVEHEGGLTIRVEYADDDDPAPEAPPAAG